MKINVQSRSGRTLIEGGLTLQDQATVEDLKRAFAQAKPKYYTSRQRFTTQPSADAPRGVPLTAADKPLSQYGVADGTTLLFKDLGTQVGYATVFFWEYFGPMALYAAIYFLPQLAYPTHKHLPEKNLTQQLALAFWVFHYAKRILETFFVHRFSHGTMPIFNLYRNCSYYWLFGAYISWFINHPLYTPPAIPRTIILLALGFACELSNLKCHLIQKNLRPAGSKEYVIPKGFLFDYVTCANYTAEIASWVCFSFATQTLAAFFFTAAGTWQMVPWAIQKHKRLRKTFDGKDGRPKYPRRWVIFPLVF
jgi:very-long-chain enoyl-CoA reductase